MRTRRTLSLLVLAVAAALAALAADGAAGPPAKKLRIGLVTEVATLDGGSNQPAYEGLLRARKELGVDVRVLRSRSPQDYVRNLATLARARYDVVIGVGYPERRSVAAAAYAFPHVRWASIDADVRDLSVAKGGPLPRNAEGILFREQEVGFLAGYLAALEALRAGEQTISTVGGLKLPPVDRYIAGFQAGARAAVPGIETLNGYSRDFVDPTKCRALALDQIARGSFVVFPVAGACGLGALEAAREHYVWGVGGAGSRALGPRLLTSARKRVDIAVYRLVESVRDGSFRGGTNASFGLSSRGVELGEVSPIVPKDEIARLEAVAAKIRSGEIANIPTTIG